MPRCRRWRDPAKLDFLFDLQRCLTKQQAYRRSNALITGIDRAMQQPMIEARNARNRYLASRKQEWMKKERLKKGLNDPLPSEYVHEPKDLPWSSLDGAVAAVKDNIRTLQPWPTTCASDMLRDFGSSTDATVVQALRNAGVAIIAKTNMDEFGMGSYSTHSAFKPVRNGLGPTVLSPGGSSGGSALAVALCQCHVALGTDTGGSVRLPAAYTGVIGFKPSYGVLSRYGVVPYANSLDTVGILAQSCSDVRDAFKIMDQHDSKDPTRVSRRARQRKVQDPLDGGDSVVQKAPTPTTPPAKATPGWAPRRIGVPVEYNIEELEDRIRDAWIRALSLLELKGHEIVPISLPSTKQALSAYYVLAPAEASSNLAKYDAVRYGNRMADGADDEGGVLYAKVRGSKFGSEVQRRILLGTYSLSADAIENYFIQAQKVRRLVQNDFDLVFKKSNPLHDKPAPPQDGVDFIVCPTAPTRPPKLNQLASQSPVDAYMNDVFTVPASLAGLPAISIPAPIRPEASYSREIFAGIQVIGQYGDDLEVIDFAIHNLERIQELDLISQKVERMNQYLIK